MIENSLTKDRLCMDLRWCKKDGYVDIGKLLQTFTAAWKVKNFVH